MSILADQDIAFFRNLGLLDVHPWDDDLLQPGSYDLRLAPYRTYKEYNLNTGETRWCTAKFPDDPETGVPTHAMEMDEFALFTSIEIVEVTPRIGAQVQGKSTWAREGLIVESAGWVDPGFCGQLTLELKNISRGEIILTAGMPIAQVVFHELRSPALRPYGERGRYMNQSGPQPPRPFRKGAGDE